MGTLSPMRSLALLGAWIRGAISLMRTVKFRFFAALFSSFMTMGMGIALIGPSLTQLGQQTNTDIGELPFVLTARSVGFFCGSLLGGYLIERFPLRGKTILFCSLISAMFLLILIPMVPWVALLACLCWLQGLTLGVIDNAAQILLIRIMDGDDGKEVQPYMQALHAAFGVGAFISPLIMSPFLSSDDVNNPDEANESSSTSYRYAYLILALFAGIVGAVMGVYMWRDEQPQYALLAHFKPTARETTSSEASTTIVAEETPTSTVPKSSNTALEEVVLVEHAGNSTAVWTDGACTLPAARTPFLMWIHKMRMWVVTQVTALDPTQVRAVVMIGGFLFLYVGTETGYGSYIFSYATAPNGLKFIHSDAALLNSLFWFSFALGRVIGIPMSLRFSAAAMIAMDLAGCILSVLLMVIFHNSSHVLWIMTVFYGISVASIYPSAINYCERATRVTGAVLSALTVCATLGEALIPLLMGLSFNWNSGPLSMMIITLVVAIGAAVLFSFILKLVPPKDDSFAAAAPIPPVTVLSTSSDVVIEDNANHL